MPAHECSMLLFEREARLIDTIFIDPKNLPYHKSLHDPGRLEDLIPHISSGHKCNVQSTCGSPRLDIVQIHACKLCTGLWLS